MNHHDAGRRGWLIACAVIGVVGVAIGVGVLGPSVGDNSSATVAVVETMIAPAGPAFSIWTVIYLALLCYVVFHSLPSRSSDARMRSTGWLAGVSLLLNALWILVAQLSPSPALGLWGSLVVISALLAVCGVIMVRLTDQPARSLRESVVVDGPFGMYLGWVSVATCANATATFVGSGLTLGSPGTEVAAMAVLLVVVCVAAVLLWRIGARVTVAGAMGWGLAWIAIGRLTDSPLSIPVAVAAAIAALAVVALLLITARRRNGLRL